MIVRFETTHGTFSITLDADKAPLTVENFLNYVRSGHYDGTIFHRIIDGFMIQGGGFLPGMEQKPVQAATRNEAANGLKNRSYTVAMARTPDPHSATCQFFVNVADNDFLDYTEDSTRGFGYCVFGTVTEGTEVIDAIRRVKTGTRGMYKDVPEEDVVILTAREA